MQTINNQKTLVIHPQDETTDFLSAIYRNASWWTVVNNNIHRTLLRKLISEHDRIIMMGHGSREGMHNSWGNLIIDSSLVDLLREKDGVYIWCHADVFVKKYNLKGFYTGMIISEVDEASQYDVIATQAQITSSNELFASVISRYIHEPLNVLLHYARAYYQSHYNPVIQYNRENMYISIPAEQIN